MAHDFIGGTGLGVRLAYDEIPPECDPLGPENKLIVATGPLTATKLATASRFQFIFKSPLTGILCDASSGDSWGADFKRAGYDVLIVQGRTEKPVYLWINNGTAELRDASHIWGKDCFSVQEVLKEEVGDKKAKVGSIGPAGERGSLHACFSNDEGRAPGRGGSGAVLGSKKLKAIVVRGTMDFPLADEEGLNRECKKITSGRWPKDEGFDPYGKHGTANWLKASWHKGGIPVKNWQIGEWKEGCLNLCGPRMSETILTRRSACYRCPLACARLVKIERGPYAFEGSGPEYETLAAMGTNTLVDNLEAVAYAGHLCNVYGIDTMSTGSTIAWAMECFEKGLLSKEDTDGIELTFGNAEELVAATIKAGKVEGNLGKLIAMGVKRAAEKVGGGSIDFACQVKGLETAMHDSRAFPSMAATYAAGPRGACHLYGQSMHYETENALPEWGLTDFDPEAKTKGMGRISTIALYHFEIYNSMVICAFLTGGYVMKPSDLAHFLNLTTGANYTADDLKTIGKRIANLHRAFNNRCGITKDDDILSKRQLTKLKEGGAKGFSPDLPAMLDEYYREIGWNREGKPSPELLAELGLELALEDLY